MSKEIKINLFSLEQNLSGLDELINRTKDASFAFKSDPGEFNAESMNLYQQLRQIETAFDTLVTETRNALETAEKEYIATDEKLALEYKIAHLLRH